MTRNHWVLICIVLALAIVLSGCFINNVGLSLTIDGHGDVITDPEHSLLGYKKGTVVKLEAVPDEGWTFVRWEGDLSGSTVIAIIKMDGPKDITAVFEEIELLPR